ncbi:Activin types I and II receptor domain [Nesidiocoris tenuis]|uniref:receptor protein serine/threonine kinase n=1 Tax=Nesidiocoris tenuis TaxID=355587 RepID=A0ABN7AZB2_9HEMI|nr:Activin types I and II receptor domain [Nesidiocoris tenuis]
MLLPICLVAFSVVVKGHDSPRICAWSRLSSSVHEEPSKLPEQQVDWKNNQVTCNRGAYCYAFWRRDPSSDNSSRITVVNRGCWEASGRGDGCSSSVCQQMSHQSKMRVNAGFCCCTGYLCNLNISSVPLPGAENHTQNLPSPRNATELRAADGERTKAFVMGGCGAALVLLLLAGVVWRFGPNVHDKDALNDRSRNHSSASQNTGSNNSYNLSQLSLDRIVGQGRYGTVWLGYLKEKPVAVKMYPAHYQQYFFNEKDIYTLPFMDHVSLLAYYGDDRIKNKDGTTSLALVLSYCPLGTLQEYLKGNTVDLMTFTNMALSISSALAFLHTEMHKQGANKPCVTHRDVNSRNILIKEDLSCCLADLSLSVKIAGSHYYALGDELHAETKSINDVGTLRYMAPEILEGAVNLRDCESSMKQIDVYALGLVLWELSMRVADFFHRLSDVPPYSMPFEREVGLHPTFEEMQVLVCRNKARPLYPIEWRNNTATRTIRETIEDCTDQDGEARLTALCVHERINQIRKAYSQTGNISPTINPTNFSTATFSSNYCYTNNISPTPEISFGEKETNDGCGSEDTVETIVTMTPSDSFHTHHSLFNRDVAMIHPHQGRNPCLERNLLNCDQREEQICIVQTSNKHAKTTTEIEIVPRPPSSTAGQLASIPIVQNRPFTSPKLINLVPKSVDQPDVNFVSSLFKLMKKKEKNCSDEETALTRVIVSPFEGETSPQRPSSLQLLPSAPASPDVDVIAEEKALKELSGRIRTPGDLPPSVRKKRGSKARLSLYDDRMMSYSALDSTF